MKGHRALRRFYVAAKQICRAKPLGDRGEILAAKHLRRKCYKIVARQYKHGRGEIDIVAVDGRVIVFVEVKTRRSHRFGHPVEAVDDRKQAQLSKLALRFLKRHGLLAYRYRFDIVAITWPLRKRPQIEHYENAFSAVDVD